jgi:hypothetical protein
MIEFMCRPFPLAALRSNPLDTIVTEVGREEESGRLLIHGGVYRCIVKFLKTECKTKARAKPMAVKKELWREKRAAWKRVWRGRISSSGGKIRCGKKK